ncbi:archaetidylserine decarboxylase [Methylophaga sp. OBS4]|uniref:archaetidylserine decarboxylase n=1 Tax=Methylophaga sp. OBS4 TaxID=2991935 RepID=UPI002254EBBC|nr:archaetidylserine decarboxylase [Methylophaga sp. OBS4]MCX4188219.1 archaetidylserine decarboxylase [Methylophaga sp. OBS4]
METNPQDKKDNVICTFWDKILTVPQYLIPQHWLSVMMHGFTRCQLHWLKNLQIRFVCWRFKVNREEAVTADIEAYPSFNAFFTRQLRDGVRPVAEGEEVVSSPVDGFVSQLGKIEQGRIVQAKGQDYSVVELLGGNTELAAQFERGQFATLYLSPRDYHRIHMPLAGQLQSMRYVPGKLFSVSPRTACTVPRLFARNERVVTVFDTKHGPMALVLVGAIFVGSMETVWSGQITPPYGSEIRDWEYDGDSAVSLAKGEEMGRFNMGSTVVILLPSDCPAFKSDWQPGMNIRLGQAMT